MEINKFYDLIDKMSAVSEIFVSDNLKQIDIRFEKFKSMIDARSLAFFCLGRKKVQNNQENITFLINSNEISSVLTAVTEAKYQQQKLIIICVGNIISRDSFTDVTSDITISNEIQKIENKIETYINRRVFKPLIINIEMNILEKKLDSEILDVISKKIEKNAKIYTNIIFDNYNNKNVIVWKNKYGVISRYLGNVVANKESKLYLLTDYKSFCQDINVFYTRYISDKIVVLYLKNREEVEKNNFVLWTKENDIKFIKIEKENINELELDNITKRTIVEILI